MTLVGFFFLVLNLAVEVKRVPSFASGDPHSLNPLCNRDTQHLLSYCQLV